MLCPPHAVLSEEGASVKWLLLEALEKLCA
jgi:hypothetical protein